MDSFWSNPQVAITETVFGTSTLASFSALEIVLIVMFKQQSKDTIKPK